MTDDARQDRDGSRLALWAEENMRRVARGATHQIALRRGKQLDMWVGCGYPKSGTVWMCKMLGSVLGTPVPIDYQLPIMMASVVHAHWTYDSRMPPAIYIRRDGRDVTVSMYFFWTMLLTLKRDPKTQRELERIFHQIYGPRFDPADVQGNMPKFIEYQMTVAPTTHGITWQQHVRDWWDRPGVGHVSYEGLLKDAATELGAGLVQATGREFDPRVLDLAAERHNFTRMSGRNRGEENRENFLRKGVAGDWRAHFTREAAEAFDHFAGDALVDFGYESDRSWCAEIH